MIKHCLAIIICAMSLQIVGAQNCFSFQDVLATPAVKSRLAEKTLLNAVVWAGNRVISVGWRGHILFSDNEGQSWSQASVPVSSDLVAVHFPTALNGWAVGHDGVVLHSQDGGITWIKQLDGFMAANLILSCYEKHAFQRTYQDKEPNDPLLENIRRLAEEGADKPFLDVWFEDEKCGYIVGAFNLIFKTVDGGSSWIPLLDRTENPKSLHLYGIRRIGKELFICGEQGLVLKFDPTTDRFKALRVPHNGSFFGIAGDASTVLAFGMRGAVYKSEDAGGHWEKVDAGLLTGLIGAATSDDGTVFLVSQEGSLLYYNANFKKLEKIQYQRAVPGSALICLKQNRFLIVGLAGAHLRQADRK